MQLSKRLLAAAGLVTKGNRVADIGCDHAYTSIYLCKEGIAPSVIAMDVRKGPLLCAKQNVELYGLTKQISLRLSDGLKALSAGEVETLLLTGMGGLLILKILSEFPEVAASAKELILQPQSEAAQVRRFLHKSGYKITTERIVKEDEKFYVLMRAVRADVPQQYEHECDYRYGRELVTEDKEVFFEFLAREKRLREEVLAKISAQETKRTKERKQELEHELLIIEAAAFAYRQRKEQK